jgi:hypothetical protein
MRSKLLASGLLCLFCLSTAPAHAQGRAIMGVLEWFGVFGRSAAADSRLLLGRSVADSRLAMREYEVGALSKNSLIIAPNEFSTFSRSTDLQRQLLLRRLTNPSWSRGTLGSDDYVARLGELTDSDPLDALFRLQIEDPATRVKLHDLLATARNAQKDVVVNSEKAATSGTDTAKSDMTKDDAPSRFKFSLADGKLKIGTLKKFENLEIEGGEIGLYKWGAAGGAAALCNTIDCYKAARRAIIEETFKTKDLKEVLESIEKAKKPELVAD